MSQTFLYNEVYPEIYKVYNEVLDKLYPEGLNTTQKKFYLQQQQESARRLHQKYLKPKKQHIEVDYNEHKIQEIYMLRYSIPHALQLPWVLDSLREMDFYHLENDLTASFFGGGPCPEILGLKYYLNKTLFNKTSISAARLDIVTNWKWHYCADTFSNFRSNLAGGESDFLDSASREWVKNSDLVVIQNCLNEIPTVSYQRLLMNMKHIVDIMKPGALMLIIEKRYSDVEKLLKEFYSELDGFNNIQKHYTPIDNINIKYLNYGHVPHELVEHLFQRVLHNWLWLTNKISFHWLAISKQMGFYDHYAGIDLVPFRPEASAFCHV